MPDSSSYLCRHCDEPVFLGPHSKWVHHRTSEYFCELPQPRATPDYATAFDYLDYRVD